MGPILGEKVYKAAGDDEGWTIVLVSRDGKVNVSHAPPVSFAEGA